ncbi:MAG: ABC transporter substrate-binding protein [Solirubrobacteraceae bacterium]
MKAISLPIDAIVPKSEAARKRRRRLAPAGLMLAMSLSAAFLAACGGGSSTSSSSSAGTRINGGTINYAAEQEPPCLQGGWVQEAYIERQYADSLVSQVSSGHIAPWLATSWSVSANGLTYTFQLKPGVKFTDGTPLNAQAVVDNFNYWTNPKTANGDVDAFIGPYFKSAVATGPLTVQVNLTKPYAPLLSTLSQGYDGILSPKGLARGVAANCTDPIGSGPFILQKWNHGQNLIFVRNPNYNSAPANALHQGPAYVDKLVWNFVADGTTRWGALTSSEDQVIYDVPTVDWPQAVSQYNTKQYITPGRPDTLTLDTYHGPFTNELVRQAFAYAINRAQAVKSAFNGEIPFDGNGALSPSTPDYDAALNDSLPYDPSKAKALLEQAGYTFNSSGIATKGGQPLTITLAYNAGTIVNTEGATLLQDLQQEWKASGFDVQLIPLTESQTFSGVDSGPTAVDATIGYWTSPTPGVLYIVWRFWNTKDPDFANTAYYNNAQLVDDIQTANSASSPAVQQADYYAAQKIVVDTAAVIGLYTQTTSDAWSKNLHDFWIEDAQGEPVFDDAFLTK